MPHTPGPAWLSAAPLLAAAGAYLWAVVAVRRRGRWWPPWRAACWCAGLTVAAVALIGPGVAGHHDFVAHMQGHLLLGMAAPLLLVPAAPVTLALRALPVGRARGLSRLLASTPVRLVSHPVTAAVLDAGGLWLLYTTGLHQATGEHPWLRTVVNAHVLAAGYLFTAAVVGVDPAPHRPGRRTRVVTLVAFLAAHAVLAKHLYGHPPVGVPADQAQAGAALMYYGGDLIDLVLIVVFCRQWYATTGPHRATTPRVESTRPPRRPWRLPESVRTGPHAECGEASARC
jgi:putative membrane protein